MLKGVGVSDDSRVIQAALLDGGLEEWRGDESALRLVYEKLGVTPDRKVGTYCNSGMQASQSFFALKYLGYDVCMYDGSMSEWAAKGGPVEK